MAVHQKGVKARHLKECFGLLVPDQETTLLAEVAAKTAEAFNTCGFDMVYFDASDGIQDVYLDRWYYLNKMHLLHYRKFDRDVLYQTSTGTGSDSRRIQASGHQPLEWTHSPTAAARSRSFMAYFSSLYQKERKLT